MTFRPTKFEDIVGQSDVINRLKISTHGFKSGESSSMPHLLIDGPPGLGKTTLACAIANELGVPILVANGANLRSIKNIIPYLLGISSKTVLFIDEVHRLTKIVEEFLYPVMEDFIVNISTDGNLEKIDIPQFTLIGATTSGGSLSQPFYDRFQMKEHLSFYTPDELAKLAGSNSQRLGMALDDEELLEIAKRSKGTPRILNARLQWYKSCVSYHKDKKMTVDEIFDSQGIDSMGLDIYDRMYIDILKKHRGTHLGLKSISTLTGIAIETIENSIEPYLVRSGFVLRTQKGRTCGNID